MHEQEQLNQTIAGGREVTIVMIEDDPGHARLIERNLRRAGLSNPIRGYFDGTSALAALLGPHAGQPEPLLILLDLNLPDMKGTEILARLRADPRLKPTPIVVLTTTDDDVEIRRCYELGCSVYIRKPIDYAAFTAAIRKLGLLLSVIEVPPTWAPVE